MSNHQPKLSSRVQFAISEPESEMPRCVEHGIWTPLPAPPPQRLPAYTLRLKDVKPRLHDRAKASAALTFHAVGCTGAFDDHEPQRAVAQAMRVQTYAPGPHGIQTEPIEPVSFLYHLGDVVYKDDTAQDAEGDGDGDGDEQQDLYEQQFDIPYADYVRPIFAIAGNHDGKRSSDRATSAIDHFLARFCARSNKSAHHQRPHQRPALTQPYPYWRLTTPVAYIIGLYSNIANGGILDDPAHPDDRPQYRWLVDQLKDARRRNAHRAARKAILLMVHYPPYSGAANFAQRGDPTLGPTHATAAQPLGALLQEAFGESGQRPDAVFAAHAHLYQRLTYRHADGREVPYLVVGSGGHGPIEHLSETCDGTARRPKKAPFEAMPPQRIALPEGDRVRVMAYNDRSFGFMRVTVTRDRLLGEFFAVDGDAVTLDDSFRLDLARHTIESPGSSSVTA